MIVGRQGGGWGHAPANRGPQRIKNVLTKVTRNNERSNYCEWGGGGRLNKKRRQPTAERILHPTSKPPQRAPTTNGWGHRVSNRSGGGWGKRGFKKPLAERRKHGLGKKVTRKENLGEKKGKGNCNKNSFLKLGKTAQKPITSEMSFFHRKRKSLERQHSPEREKASREKTPDCKSQPMQTNAAVITGGT